MEMYGYILINNAEQDTKEQLQAIQEKGVMLENIFVDKLSSKDIKRPQYKKLTQRLSNGDLLFVMTIDQLGCSYEEIKREWKVLTMEKGVDICVLQMPLLDTRDDKYFNGAIIAELVLQILTYVSKGEKEIIKEKQKKGIAAAKKRGVRFGRPEAILPDNFEKIVDDWENGLIDINEAIKQCGVSEATFYRRLRELRISQGRTVHKRSRSKK